jgi:hypothetical protein
VWYAPLSFTPITVALRLDNQDAEHRKYWCLIDSIRTFCIWKCSSRGRIAAEVGVEGEVVIEEALKGAIGMLRLDAAVVMSDTNGGGIGHETGCV